MSQSFAAFLRLLGAVALVGLFLVAVSRPWGSVPALGHLLDPLDGLYRTARQAQHPSEQSLSLPGLSTPVTVIRDERGVPHIFAESDQDAITALGYVVAQDRLFQLDFIPRVASGGLAEILGPLAVSSDRFLRRTGMDWGARKTLATLEGEDLRSLDIIGWYASGVNAYLDGLDEADLPFEFRLLGYKPARYTPLQAIRLLQYMTFDLTYRTDATGYAALQKALPPEDYDYLYPRYNDLMVPIIPERGGGVTRRPAHTAATAASETMWSGEDPMAFERPDARLAEGFIHGKGSNNWAVGPGNSTTGAAILAGDMHLSLTLPAIWYEVHLATPTMNTYGVTIPGSPLPVEAFNDHLAWAFTNTGSDQIDHLALTLDETGTRYKYDDTWRDLTFVPDTIRVKGSTAVIDTLVYSHLGPVTFDEDQAIALRWVAHEPTRTLEASWGMNHATDYATFEDALRYWDTPMQNILYADKTGTIAIRSTGFLPVRKSGHGVGLLDGSTDTHAWIGRVPFEELPHSINPAQGFLTSTNQQPADETYPHYLGHDWRAAYRSLRIDTLLRAKARHSVEDLKSYQADVHAIQRDLFVPLIDTLHGLTPRADSLRQLLAAWDGATAVDRPEPLVLDEFLRVLRAQAWDEPPFEAALRPSETRLYRLLTERPTSPWLDVVETTEREDAGQLLRRSLEETAVRLDSLYGWGTAHWRWGDHHTLELRHLTQTPQLKALWRTGLEYPGFAATLSPAAARQTTHSASWRVVVDFSVTPPQGYGVYPGGQSGNPFSPHYDAHVGHFVSFQHYTLHKPNRPEDLAAEHISSTLRLSPP